MTDRARKEALAQTARIAERAPQAYRGMLHLQEWLDYAGISQFELSRRLMRVRATVNNWCTGRCCPVANDLPSIAEALGCTIAELFIPPTEMDADEFDEEARPE